MKKPDMEEMAQEVFSLIKETLSGYTEEEFKAAGENAWAFAEKSIIENESLQPMLHIEVVIKGKPSIMVVALEMPDTHEEKIKLFSDIGKTAAKQSDHLRAVFQMSECWTLMCDKESEEKRTKRVSEMPNKKEAVMVTGLSPLKHQFSKIGTIERVDPTKFEGPVESVELKDFPDDAKMQDSLLFSFLTGYMSIWLKKLLQGG